MQIQRARIAEFSMHDSILFAIKRESYVEHMRMHFSPTINDMRAHGKSSVSDFIIQFSRNKQNTLSFMFCCFWRKRNGMDFLSVVRVSARWQSLVLSFQHLINGIGYLRAPANPIPLIRLPYLHSCSRYANQAEIPAQEMVVQTLFHKMKISELWGKSSALH